MKIVIAGDHTSLELKEILIQYISSNGYNISDLGTTTSESVDYPDYAKLVALHIQQNPQDFGILICGSGIGMSIAANRYHSVRAALCTNEYLARLSRQHNDSNVLVLGSRVIGIELAKSIFDAWIRSLYEGDRHRRRIEKIENLVT